MTNGFSACLFLAAGLASATALDIPYAPGAKLSGSVEVSTHSGDLASGSHRISPDTVKIGAVTLRFFVQPGPYPAVCGFKPAMGVQFTVSSFGSARQSTDTSSAWSGFDAYPHGNVIPLDSVRGASFQDAHSDTLTAPGYYFVEAGERNDCSGSAFSLRPYWNRVVFARWGSGVDYAAKISIQSYRDTTFGMLPMYQVLRSITIRYVVNTTSTDLSDPVSVRPARPGRGESRFGARMEHELYNPLGIRLRREPGRYEPAFYAPRASGEK